VTTAGNLIDRVIQPLLAGTVEERNKIAASLNTSDTTVTATYDLGGLSTQTVFEIESELFYVWDANQTSKTLTVERGYGGTTAASHASGAVLTASPKFPRKQVLDALNSELADLSSPMNGLFQMKTVDLSYNGSDRMVNLTGVTDIIDFYEARLRYLSDDYPIIKNVRFLRNMPTTDFASGLVLAFDDDVRSGTVRVLYKAPYTAFASEASTVASTGAATELEDLLVLGAQIRVLAGREVKRNFIESQGDTRRADEVQAGAMGNSMTGLMRLRRDRIQAEAARLARQYPLRIRK
jgi:Leucine-rich repeat (LRR) protein